MDNARSTFRARRFALLPNALIASTLAATACTVDVPGIDEAVFLCAGEGDCADGYRCDAVSGTCVSVDGATDKRPDCRVHSDCSAGAPFCSVDEQCVDPCADVVCPDHGRCVVALEMEDGHDCAPSGSGCTRHAECPVERPYCAANGDCIDPCGPSDCGVDQACVVDLSQARGYACVRLQAAVCATHDECPAQEPYCASSEMCMNPCQLGTCPFDRTCLVDLQSAGGFVCTGGPCDSDPCGPYGCTELADDGYRCEHDCPQCAADEICVAKDDGSGGISSTCAVDCGHGEYCASPTMCETVNAIVESDHYDAAARACVCKVDMCRNHLQSEDAACVGALCVDVCDPLHPESCFEGYYDLAAMQCVVRDGCGYEPCADDQTCTLVSARCQGLMHVCSDACDARGCPGGCVIEPILGDTQCLLSGIECGGRAGDCGGGEVCVWAGETDGRGYCAEPGCAQCSSTSEVCASFPHYDDYSPVNVCIDTPVCTPTCTPGEVCVFRSGAFVRGVCQSGCRTSGDCPAGDECVRENRSSPPGDSFLGVCATTYAAAGCNGSCGAAETCSANVQRHEDGQPVGYACQPQQSGMPTCSDGTSCLEDEKCTLALYGQSPSAGCFPSCQASAVPCPKGTDCTTLPHFDPTTGYYVARGDACMFGGYRLRYQAFDGLSTPTPFDHWQAPTMDSVGPQVTCSGCRDVTRVGEQHIIAPRHDGTTDLYRVRSGESPVLRCHFEHPTRAGAVGREGGQEILQTITSCPGTLDVSPPCAPANVPYLHIATVRTSEGGTTAECDLEPYYIGHPTDSEIGYILGDTHDGMMAVVGEYAHGIGRLRVGRLVDDPAYPSWAPRSVYVERPEVIKDVRVSRDLVVWVVENADTSTSRVYLRTVSDFSAAFVSDWVPFQDPRFDGSTIVGLTVEDNWMAWTEDLGGNDRIALVSVDVRNLSDPGNRVPTYFEESNVSNSSLHMRASLHRGYMAYADHTMVRVRELFSGKADLAAVLSYNQMALPVLFVDEVKASVWSIHLDVSQLRESVFE